ncbi:GyrI-like domain-containing protein [Pontibacter sp. KCTC 32443]|uniref:GyrI-like domain-containing protein n=1 Tax=Pontibacter TaxID=323449 RepID=UPI00164E0F9B|nr:MULTISPECIES: GyrI-like domain-containing protein [Pontibacter]MBC5774493.1 GyrI-like domain-containing protein [Pontibacter sp. KCTC 32443]
MSKKFVVAMAIIVAIGVGIYAYLGGFSTPTVTVTTSEPLILAGQPFTGTVKDEAFGNAFRRAAQLRDTKELEGLLGNVYYNNPESKSDSIKAFIGIVIQDSTARLPEGYELLHVPGGRKVVRGEVEAHYMVGPGKLYSSLFDYAEEEKLKLESFYVEWFPSDRKGVVEVPVKQ